jgi:transposase
MAVRWLASFDAAWPQPTDNSRRTWSVEDPHLERQLLRVDCPGVGFYALNGESVITFPEKQTKENICAAFEKIREQNPGKRILLVLDNFSSHTCEYTRRRATELGIDLVFLPVASPHLNPIEQVWKSLKWHISPIAVASRAEFRNVVRDTFETLTRRVSFAQDWIDRFLNIQKLS